MRILGPEQQFYCQRLCSDKRNFEAKIYNARRINQMLERIIFSKNIKKHLENDEKINFLYFKSHIHFMCGNCNKINKNELDVLERNILNNCNYIKTYLKNNKNEKGLKYEVLRLLQGHYSKIYKWFER